MPERARSAEAAGTVDLERLAGRAAEATAMLKALAHAGRLTILCQLAAGEKSVSELETLLSARQSAVSQQLARLRREGFVTARRDGKTIWYSLADPKARQIVEMLYDLYCRDLR